MLGTILLIILILILIGALPTWPYSSGWGYYPSGGAGLILGGVLVDNASYHWIFWLGAITAVLAAPDTIGKTVELVAQGAHAVGIDVVYPAVANRMVGNQPGVLQHLEVLRDRGPRDGQALRELPHRPRPAGEQEGQLYITMRYVEGTDLKSRLERDGKLTPARTIELLAQVCDDDGSG
jgi:serine/threonine protein kinase